MWSKFHFFCGIAVPRICITQTTAFSCCKFHFIYMHAWCVSCNKGRRNASWLCESVIHRLYKCVIVAFISSWKLKFLAYMLNVTTFRYAYHFIRKYCVFHFYLTIAVGNVCQLSKLLRPWVHGAAQARRRKTLKVSKDSRAVCSQNSGTYDIYDLCSYAIQSIFGAKQSS